MLAYVICGILVGIAAIFYVGAYTTVQPGYGDQYNNEAIAGCVMGGTSMAGGLASIGGTVIGVLIISLLQQGILALGFSKDYQFIITGIIVIAAVFTKTQSVSWLQSSDANGWYRNFVKAGNVPTGLIIFLAAAIVCGVVLNKSKAGRYILCLGINKEAVRLYGVAVKKWEMSA